MDIIRSLVKIDSSAHKKEGNSMDKRMTKGCLTHHQMMISRPSAALLYFLFSPLFLGALLILWCSSRAATIMLCFWVFLISLASLVSIPGLIILFGSQWCWGKIFLVLFWRVKWRWRGLVLETLPDFFQKLTGEEKWWRVDIPPPPPLSAFHLHCRCPHKWQTCFKIN